MAVHFVGNVLKGLSKTYLEKKGYVLSTLLNNWDFVVGESYAAYCLPEKIFFKKGEPGTLYLNVYSPSMLMSLQHVYLLLIEKINTYFGYTVLEKIIFKRAIMPEKIKPKAPLPPPPDNPAVQELLSDFPEGDLKERLRDLGKRLHT